MLISVKGTGKNHLQPGQERKGDAPVLWHFFFYEIHDQNWLVRWSIAVNEKPIVGSPIFRFFPSDHILKVTKVVNAQFLIHSSSSCELYQRILGTFRSYYI
jgi:hypothetical protein